MDHQLRIDWIRCDGYGLCGDYAPDLIDLDEWRYPILRSGPIAAGLLHEAQRAVDCCPMKALVLERVGADGSRPDQGRTARFSLGVRRARGPGASAQGGQG